MVRYSIKTTACLTAGALTLLATPAKAAPPGAGMEISALGLSGQQIPPNELNNIRGGFNMGAGLSISFAFKQIEAVNGIIVKSIMVPEINVTAAAGTSATSHGNGTPYVTPVNTPAVLVTDATGTTQTVTQSSSGNINLTTKANNGQTTINTQFGANGLSNLMANQANNTAVSVAATMNIAISGMSGFLTQQQTFANARSGLYYAGSAFK